MESPEQIVVQNEEAAACDCSHGQLFGTGRAELADDEDVERQPACPGNLEGHGNASTDETEHNSVFDVRQLSYKLTQHATRLPTILKDSFTHAQDCKPASPGTHGMCVATDCEPAEK